MNSVDRLRALLAKADDAGVPGHLGVCTCEDCMRDIYALNAAMREALPALLDVTDVAFKLRELFDWAAKNDDGIMGASIVADELRSALAALERVER